MRDFLAPLFACLCVSVATAAPDDAAPIKRDAATLADRISALADPAEQARVAAAAPEAIRGKPLRDAIANCEYQLGLKGEYGRAERLCHLLERLGSEAGDARTVAQSQVLLSSVFREYGDYTNAVAALDRALGYYKEHPKEVGIVGVYQGKGITQLDEGDFAHALVSLQNALQTAERLKFREGIIPALNSTGEVYREQGLPERALDFYARARAVVGNDSAWNMAFIFNNIGQAYEAMGDRAKAVEFIEKARAVADQNNMKPRVATSLAVLAKIAREEGRFDDAQKQYEQSLAISREIHDLSSEGRALLGLAETARQRGNLEAALARAKDALALYRKTAQPDQIAAALTSEGKTLRARGDAGAARKALEEAIAETESLRGMLAGAEAESEAFFEKRIAPYQELTSLLVEQHENVTALATAERASARVLLDVTSRGSSAASAAVLTDTETARQRDLDRHIAELNRQLSSESSTKDLDEHRLAEISDALRDARHARENFDAEIVAAHPELKRNAPAPPITRLEQLAPLVSDGRTAAIKFAVTDTRSYAFVLHRGDNAEAPQLDVVTIEVSRADLGNRASSFRAALADRSLAWQRPARELYDLLLGRAEPLCANANRLIIAPDGPLWEVPFLALVDARNRPIAETAAVSVAPSLSALLEDSRHDSKAPPDNVAVFANPSVANTPNAIAAATSELVKSRWRPLPEMEKQARAIQRLYPDNSVQTFIGDAAREETAKRELPRAALIEFATHGVLNNRAPLYSYLLLSQSHLAAGEDGLLEGRELMRMQLRARLAILCGCETARGRIGAGEGVIGLSWSLLVAGCPSTIVSQWKVEEAATTPLMLALHRELLAGTPKDEALRRAAIELRKNERYRHPFYWAPFVLVGDPR